MRVMAVASAAIAAALVVVPDVALSSSGRLHGPSATPLLVELLAAALATLALVLRRPAGRVIRSAVHHATDGLRFVAHHRPHRAG
jgi:hypothetical protein